MQNLVYWKPNEYQWEWGIMEIPILLWHLECPLLKTEIL